MVWTSYVPSVVAAAVTLLVLVLLHRRLSTEGRGLPIGGQVTQLVLTVTGLLAVVLLMPNEATRRDVLAFLGVVLSAAVAFSSTTLLGNLMAGLMLRAVRSFRIGDYVRVEDCFGRVSELGLFHAEIQTEDRDLVTLPNLWLTNRPVQVVRSSGTVIAATVSIGYDEPHARIRGLLTEAAAAAELEEPFVQVLELGDHAITYRAAGMLRDLKHIVSSRSKLRMNVLDALHGAGVEIVSPEFRVVRMPREAEPVVPPVVQAEASVPPGEPIEAVVFDKAEEAASIETLKERLEELAGERKRLLAEAKAVKGDERARLEERGQRLDELSARLEVQIRERESHAKD